MAQPTTNARLAAVQIIDQLHARGHVAYLAGGCVRDALMGQEPKDYDVATDATPDQVQAIFPKSAAVGAAFATTGGFPSGSPLRSPVRQASKSRAPRS